MTSYSTRRRLANVGRAAAVDKPGANTMHGMIIAIALTAAGCLACVACIVIEWGGRRFRARDVRVKFCQWSPRPRPTVRCSKVVVFTNGMLAILWVRGLRLHLTHVHNPSAGFVGMEFLDLCIGPVNLVIYRYFLRVQ